MGFSLQTEELGDGGLVQLGADDTEAAHHIGGAEADILLAGDEVKVDPLAVSARHDALGTQNDAVLAGIQLLQNGADLLGGVLLGSLTAPGGEDLVGVVVMMVMAAAGALLAMLVMVMVLVVVMMNVYHQTLRLSFVQYLRPVHSFPSIEALINQLSQDEQQARALLKNEKR